MTIFNKTYWWRQSNSKNQLATHKEQRMNHEKLETIKQITLAALVIAIMFSFLYWLNAPERLRLAQVQSGELILECHIKKTGLTIIAPEKVTGHSDITWWFTNGVSSRCTTKEKEQ